MAYPASFPLAAHNAANDPDVVVVTADAAALRVVEAVAPYLAEPKGACRQERLERVHDSGNRDSTDVVVGPVLDPSGVDRVCRMDARVVPPEWVEATDDRAGPCPEQSAALFSAVHAAVRLFASEESVVQPDRCASAAE
jgi:hypothetical protein